MSEDSRALSAPVTYFVLSRPLSAKHLPWRARTEAPSYAAAEAQSIELVLLGGPQAIETQIVASSALRAAELARCRSEIVFAAAAARSEVRPDATADGAASCARCGQRAGLWVARNDDGGVRRAYHPACAALHDREARVTARSGR